MFLPLNKHEIAEVVRLQMDRVRNMLKEQGVELRITDNAIDYIATQGYDPEYGARPVKRAIQRLVLNDLSKNLLAEEVRRDMPVVVDADDNGLVFRS